MASPSRERGQTHRNGRALQADSAHLHREQRRHQSYPRSPRPCAGDMYEHRSHGTRGGSGNLLLHLHLHRQRRGRGRKGERQPNLRHPRTFRARVASARYHHHARPHRRKRDVGKYQLHQPVGRHRQWRQQRRRRRNRGKSVGITETELRCDNRAGGEHGTHAPLRPPPMQREEQQQTGGQLFAVVLFRNELILRGYFVRVHLFFVPLAYQTSKRNMGIKHFITKEKNYEKLQNHQ